MELDALRATTLPDLEHYGVPGMKWGKRKASSAINRAKTRVKEEVVSKKREYDVRKSYANRANMSPEQLKRVSNRAASEQRIKKNLSTQFKNQLKSGRIIIDKPLMNDRKLYRNRGKMSEQILRQFENRVNLETQMSRVYSKTLDTDLRNAQKVIDSYRKYSMPIKK